MYVIKIVTVRMRRAPRAPFCAHMIAHSLAQPAGPVDAATPEGTSSDVSVLAPTWVPASPRRQALLLPAPDAGAQPARGHEPLAPPALQSAAVEAECGASPACSDHDMPSLDDVQDPLAEAVGAPDDLFLTADVYLMHTDVQHFQELRGDEWLNEPLDIRLASPTLLIDSQV